MHNIFGAGKLERKIRFVRLIGGRVLSRTLKSEDERDLRESSSKAEMFFRDAFTPLYY
jgi:hypothetical protein